jgi:cytochrome c biogenesis protein
MGIGETRVSDDLGLSITLASVSEYTLLIAKHDPGQGLIWLAFASLIAGITISFYLPRRRVWTRLTGDGRLGIVWRSERYVDVEREFGRLLDDLVAARHPT